jgi:hypothetical protein
MSKEKKTSLFEIPCSVFCGSLFSNTCLPAVAWMAEEGYLNT